MRKNKIVGISLFTVLVFFSSCFSKEIVPKPDHVLIIIEENHGYDQIINSANAPYINHLAKEGTLFTNSQAITHPSQPNYLGLFSGSTQGVDGDECLDTKTPFTTPNLGAALLQAGYTFKAYSESLPKAGSLECFYEQSKGYDYARKHAPWVNWQGNKENDFPDSLHQPFTNFPTDFNQLPTISFVVPNEGNDMHNIDVGGDTVAIKRADKWLKDHLSGYVQWAKKHNSLLILTFDEDQNGSMLENHIATIFVGAKVKKEINSNYINHYSVLATIESMYHLPLTANAKDAKTIEGIWK
jgi:phosphatidylinositol-3-phosphatase